MAQGISTVDWISLGLTAVGTVATVIFVAQQSAAAKTAATTAQAASTNAQTTNQRTQQMMRHVGLARGRTGLGW
jgi:hypothetical protein